MWPPPFDVLVVSDIEAWRGPSAFFNFRALLLRPLLSFGYVVLDPVQLGLEGVSCFGDPL